MSEAERTFLTTVTQIIPVLLLALVLEARLFRFGFEDALPAVKDARKELRSELHPAIYGLWRFRMAYRRWGISTILHAGLAGLLAFAEIAGLVSLARDAPLSDRAQGLYIAALGAGIVFVAVKPLLNKIIEQNVQLVQLEAEVNARVGQAAAVAPDAHHPSTRKRKSRKGKGKTD